MISLSADIVLILFVWILYYLSLSGPFLFDDLAILESLKDHIDPARVSTYPFVDFFRSIRVAVRSRRHLLNFWLSRPLTQLTYRRDLAASYLDPRGWHRTSVWIHIFSVLVAHHIFLHFFPPLPSFLGAAVFASHPLATMAVSYIAGRSSALTSLFMLLAVLMTLHHLWPLVLIFALLAFLAKPEAVILPFLVGGLWWFRLI